MFPTPRAIALLLCFLPFWNPVLLVAETGLSSSDVANDLAYYERLSDRKKLSANDRLFLLYRLQDKYLESGLDLSPLEKEIQRWEKVRKQAKVARQETPRERKAAAPDSAAELRSIQRREKQGLTTVTLALSQAVIPQAKRIDDPKKPGRPLLWIELPKTRAVLSASERARHWESGPLSDVRVSPLAGNDLRVEFELRGEPSFRVIRVDADVIVEIKDEAPGTVGWDARPDEDAPQIPPELPAARMPAVEEASPTENIGPIPSSSGLILMGQVARPGDYPFEDGMTTRDLIERGGGAARGASLREVKIFRQVGSQRKPLPVNMASVLKGHPELDVVLRPGDVVLVPQKSRGRGPLSGFLPWLYLAALIAALAIAL